MQQHTSYIATECAKALQCRRAQWWPHPPLSVMRAQRSPTHVSKHEAYAKAATKPVLLQRPTAPACAHQDACGEQPRATAMTLRVRMLLALRGQGPVVATSDIDDPAPEGTSAKASASEGHGAGIPLVVVIAEAAVTRRWPRPNATHIHKYIR